ncbi:MAG: hypothetical protein ACKOED_17510 [Aestuariivirga sp.]|uniref:hypothetical protein n=1 Tax=Aestuariivirga sp. TaxID=2650926 RepID=UPI0038D0119E
MFCFKFKVPLRCLRKLRAAARLRYARRSGGNADPRDIQRMEDDLRRARELVRLQVTRGRLLW